ncbi:MAG: hypothetical protein ACI9VR_002475 [Cognaticolwellia sp.]
MSNGLIDKLSQKDIHARADAGRQLSKVGEPEHILPLLKAAIEDPSPGVRLYAVGAAADILSRYRVGKAAKAISKAERQSYFASFKHVDPGQNAGVFSVIAVLGLPELGRRLLTGLQDPRLDVRTGAIVGTYRYFISHAASKDRKLKADLLKLLSGARLRPDVLSAIVRLIGQCGWQEARGEIEALRGRFGQVDESIEQSLGWLDEQADDETLLGAWASYGRDAGEVSEDKSPTEYLLIAPLVAARFHTQGVQTMHWSIQKDGINLGDNTQSMRRMTLDEPVDHEMVQAIQLEGQTWFRTATGAAELAERFSTTAGSMDPEVGRLLAETFLAALPESAVGDRIKARVELAVGMNDSALERLEALGAKKTVSAEVFYYLAQARKSLGNDAGAREAWTAFLDKARKTDPMREQVEALLKG